MSFYTVIIGKSDEVGPFETMKDAEAWADTLDQSLAIYISGNYGFEPDLNRLISPIDYPGTPRG